MPKGGGGDPVVEDPTTAGERAGVARVCMSALALEPMPAVVDSTSRAYDAWPDRLYLVGRDGTIAYQGAPGPDGFSVGDLELAITAELAGTKLEPTRLPGASTSSPTRAEARTDIERRADDAHSLIGKWRRIEGDHFELLSTCDLRTARVALQWVDWVQLQLIRIFGRSPDPDRKPQVLITRSLVQYNAFAITRPEPDRVPPEALGYSAFHHAFPCDSWLDRSAEGERSRPAGAGAGYWDDRSPSGDLWGPYSARHAAAHAFIEALDPSRVAVAAYLDGEPFDAAAFWSEKRIPLWLRYGAAMYVERFFIDDIAGSPHAIRQWSLGEVRDVIGLGPELAQEETRSLVKSAIDSALACDLGPQRVTASRQAILVAGALVAFVLDGDEPGVRTAHAAFREALQDGEGARRAANELERAIRVSTSAFVRFVRE